MQKKREYFLNRTIDFFLSKSTSSNYPISSVSKFQRNRLSRNCCTVDRRFKILCSGIIGSYNNVQAMLRSHRLFESLMPTKTLLKSMEISETPSKSCKQMRRKRFTVLKLELKKKLRIFFSYIFKYEEIQHICK